MTNLNQIISADAIRNLPNFAKADELCDGVWSKNLDLFVGIINNADAEMDREVSAEELGAIIESAAVDDNFFDSAKKIVAEQRADDDMSKVIMFALEQHRQSVLAMRDIGVKTVADLTLHMANAQFGMYAAWETDTRNVNHVPLFHMDTNLLPHKMLEDALIKQTARRTADALEAVQDRLNRNK